MPTYLLVEAVEQESNVVGKFGDHTGGRRVRRSTESNVGRCRVKPVGVRQTGARPRHRHRAAREREREETIPNAVERSEGEGGGGSSGEPFIYEAPVERSPRGLFSRGSLTQAGDRPFPCDDFPHTCSPS